MNKLENIHTQEQFNFLEQSRETVLRLGYRYIVFKSKVKRSLTRKKLLSGINLKK